MFHFTPTEDGIVWYDITPLEAEELIHYGMKFRSGRYPYGSGENPYQHDETWLGRYRKSKYVDGKSDKEIALELGITQAKLRKMRSNEEYQEREWLRTACKRYSDQGLSNPQIAKKLNLASESTVRSLLDDTIAERQKIANSTANALRDKVDECRFVDVGKGTEAVMGISATKLETALNKLEAEGYQVKNIQVDQLGTEFKTTMRVLISPDATVREVYENLDKIEIMNGVKSDDGGRTYAGIEPPTSVSSSRIMVRYAENGGLEKDGTIEIRRGAEDLSLGTATYAQVRIMVDDTHYIKGMAVYNDHMPDGVDIIVNSNKHEGTPLTDPDPDAKTVLKPIKTDKDNPFGAVIKTEDGVVVGQRHYKDPITGEDKLSPVNIIREEGDWDKWSKSLASQMLSKQPIETAKKQLELAAEFKKQELNDILALEQPELRRAMLLDFADSCDVDSVELKGAALPRQATKAILPIPSLKDNEVYAPGYSNGEEVILIRYPHGGIFEIPRLRVNNLNKEGKEVLGNLPEDAIGINSKVAAHLSGADFDGDTVLIIPTKGQKLDSAPYLKELQDFDDKESYPYYPGMHVMTDREHGLEMGKITNLINDMTMMNAPFSDIARAVKHSMVVVDAKKHKLDYKRSYEENGIRELYIKYRGSAGAGAMTVVSQASAEKHVNQRKQIGVDKETGEKKYKETGDEKVFRKEKEDGTYELVRKLKQTDSTKMAEVDDAYELVYGKSRETALPREIAYAEYANTMKAMALNARKDAMAIKSTSYDPEAYDKYREEVGSLKVKYNEALKNAPRERKAQALANVWLKEKKKENPELRQRENADKVKKLKGQLLTEARRRTGAKRYPIDISDKEWEAIMSGACSSSFLQDLFQYADSDQLRERAMPKKETRELAKSKQSRIASLAAAGYTTSEIAAAIGCSPSTVQKYKNGGAT